MRMERKNKLPTIIAHNYTTGKFLDYILLPYGLYYKPENSKLKNGSVMQFLTSEQVVVKNAIEIDSGTGEAEILCKMKYNFSIKTLLAKLVGNAILTGEENQIDTSKLILVTYVPYISE